MRTILDVLEYYEAHSEKQVALIFLDAEKVFDNVNWNFMLKHLEYIGIGQRFRDYITAIYTQQRAKIKINTEITEEIRIEKGTRQGCPLSPLLKTCF